jgi:mRNA degradation ribonuclease J1/J2
MRGFVFAKEAVPLLKSLSQIFVEEVELSFQGDDPSFKTCITNVKERTKRFIMRENGREPLVIPIIIPVA